MVVSATGAVVLSVGVSGLLAEVVSLFSETGGAPLQLAHTPGRFESLYQPIAFDVHLLPAKSPEEVQYAFCTTWSVYCSKDFTASPL